MAENFVFFIVYLTGSSSISDATALSFVHKSTRYSYNCEAGRERLIPALFISCHCIIFKAIFRIRAASLRLMIILAAVWIVASAVRVISSPGRILTTSLRLLAISSIVRIVASAVRAIPSHGRILAAGLWILTSSLWILAVARILAAPLRLLTAARILAAPLRILTSARVLAASLWLLTITSAIWIITTAIWIITAAVRIISSPGRIIASPLRILTSSLRILTSPLRILTSARILASLRILTSSLRILTSARILTASLRILASSLRVLAAPLRILAASLRIRSRAIWSITDSGIACIIGILTGTVDSDRIPEQSKHICSNRKNPVDIVSDGHIKSEVDKSGDQQNERAYGKHYDRYEPQAFQGPAPLLPAEQLCSNDRCRKGASDDPEQRIDEIYAGGCSIKDINELPDQICERQYSEH